MLFTSSDLTAYCTNGQMIGSAMHALPINIGPLGCKVTESRDYELHGIIV